MNGRALTRAEHAHAGHLVAAMLGPDLPAPALCKGRAPLHDLQLPGETRDQAEERHEHAAALCYRCPALTACAAARDQLGDLAAGVWAGQTVGRLTRTIA